jgi:hypothetical protein
MDAVSPFVAVVPGLSSVAVRNGAVVIGPVPPAEPLRAMEGVAFRHSGGELRIWLNDAWAEFGVASWYDDNSGGPVVWRVETCSGATVAGPLSLALDAASTFDGVAGRPRRHSFGSVPAGIYVLRHAGGTWSYQPVSSLIVGEQGGPYLGKVFWRGWMLDGVRSATCPV